MHVASLHGPGGRKGGDTRGEGETTVTGACRMRESGEVRHTSPISPISSIKPGQRGQSAVEFLLAIPIVLLLLSGIFEFGRHYYTRLTLRHAVAEAGRFAVTGNTVIDTTTGQPMTRANSIISAIIKSAGDLDVDLSRITLTPPDGGGPGEVVTISATYRYQFVLAPIARLFGPGYLDFTVSTIMLNEPRF